MILPDVLEKKILQSSDFTMYLEETSYYKIITQSAIYGEALSDRLHWILSCDIKFSKQMMRYLFQDVPADNTLTLMFLKHINLF